MTQNAINNTASILAVDNLTLDGNTLSSTDTNGDIVLAPDGTGDVSVTTAPIVPSGDRADSLGSTTNSWDNVYCDGVSFDDGTTVLASYLDTTWTPALEFGGGTTGITYDVQSGSYIRIGAFIFAYFNIDLSSKGSSTGTATITGLPATVSGIGQPVIVSRYSNITFPASSLSLYIGLGSGTTAGTLRSNRDGLGVSTLNDTNFADTSSFNAFFFYRTA